MIQVLIVDDSDLIRDVLRDIVQEASDMTVMAEVTNGQEAVEVVQDRRPDVITMDLMMPVMGGIEAIERIMAYEPTPILVLSSALHDEMVDNAFRAVRAGALDVMDKPEGMVLKQSEVFRETLRQKIRTLSQIQVVTHLSGKHRRPPLPLATAGTSAPQEHRVLAIGASTGGPHALARLLRRLPPDFPASILVVQHIDPGFSEGLANWLDSEIALKTRLGEHGEAIALATVYVAPPQRHLAIAQGQIQLLDAPPVNACRPSVDVLFDSVAREYGTRATGVILTGMGADGARGLQALHDAGGHTLAQDEKSCVIFGMPKAAIEAGAVDEVLPLEKIPEALIRRFS